MERRTWVPFLVAAALAVTGVAVVLAASGTSAPRCATSVKARSPLVAPSRFGDDVRLGTLARSVDAMPDPVGAVRAGVGFDYGQWLHLYGVAGGVLAFTKDNPGLTLLDGTSLKARWALRPETKRIAWDASDKRLAVLDLSSEQNVRVGSYDLASGKERWCVELTTRHRDGEPVSTAFLDDGDLLVVLPTSTGLGIARLSGSSGHVRWFNRLERVGRADFVEQLDEDSVLVGGVEPFRLAEDRKKGDPEDGLAVFSLKDGRREQQLLRPAAGRVHVVGRDAELVLSAFRKGTSTYVFAIEPDGDRPWQRRLPDATVDVTLRGGVVLARTRTAFLAYSAQDGVLRWSEPIPQDRTYIPYGFTLGQMPSLDRTHLLVPTTTTLQVLDVTTGRHQDFALPVDGVSTTYWAYQLLVTDRLLGVVTNTGAVLADRDVGAVG